MMPFHTTWIPESLSGTDLDDRLAMGWYRMHQTIFATSHLCLEECYQVHWLRLPLLQFVDRPAHHRIRKRNRSFRVIIEDFTTIHADHEELYSRYHKSIDFDCSSTVHDILFGETTADRNIFRTHCISVFDGDKLIAVGYFDTGDNSAASILHFFDPAYRRYSLGKYLALVTVDFLKSGDYIFLYPGYVLTGNTKMDYKLFLGKKGMEYFDPMTGAWNPFQESILDPEKSAISLGPIIEQA